MNHGQSPLHLAIFFVFLVATTAVLILNISRAKPLTANIVTPSSRPCPVLNCAPCPSTDSSTIITTPSSENESEPWSFVPERDANDYSLSLDQCDAAFPGLFKEIDDRVKERQEKPITEDELSKPELRGGSIRCMIYDGTLYVLDTNKADMRRSRQFSTMLAISRALIAAPRSDQMPNVEFVISIEDWTTDDTLPIWAYDRKAEQNKTWLMPDFGFWGWPEPGIGSYAEVRKRMEDIEAERSFVDKESKLFWRGAIVPSVAPILRQHLVDVVKDQPWADIKVLNWEAGDAESNRVPIEDHCKHQFLANTEGRAWSGRLKYIQNCRSVVVAHKLDWILPHTHLMAHDGEDQNFVQVERDFSDLKGKMEYYTSYPEQAERIAENNVRTFRDRYLTPAAEACYWRRLIHGWAKVSFTPRFYEGEGTDRKWRGVPFDSYVLMRTMHWDPT